MSGNSLQDDIDFLLKNIDKYPDFPKPGINFRDTISLCKKPECFKKMIDVFSDHISKLNVDVIVGLEARGFILGSAIAYKLSLPFVPIRKKGKLPGKTRAYKYDLEYGSDIVEIQEESILPGQKVVIVDDLIATGGTCAAAIELINSVKAEVVECVVLVELTDLDWRSKVHVKTTSFIKVDESS